MKTIELRRSKINNLKAEYSLSEVYGDRVGDEEFKCWYKIHFGIFWATPVKIVEDIKVSE